MDGLRDLGFYTCGFGCMSCIGNLAPFCRRCTISPTIWSLPACFRNRNFEGRISPGCVAELPGRSGNGDAYCWRAPWTGSA